jgi:hypothetical protein
LVYHLLEETRQVEVYRALSLQKSTFQGFSPARATPEYIDKVRAQAIEGVQDFGRCIIPWAHWPTPAEVREQQKKTLVAESQEQILAWIMRFDPQNIEKYRASGDIS